MTYFFLSIFLLAAALLLAQNTTLSGYVRDADNGEELIGANIYFPSLQKGAVTNEYGYYSISVPQNAYEVKFLFIGYAVFEKEIDLRSDVRLDVELRPESVELMEVVLTDDRSVENVQSIEMSVTDLSIKEVKKIPALLGEADIIRTLQLMPGVSTVGEGATGFNVRGGNIDQNLILLDEAPVYNSSHLFGFFSVFNSDAVKDAKLYKGGIPAQYGGRLSSVLDVRQKEGNSKRFAGTGGLGLLSSRLTLEGPIQKDKSSFMVAGRRSYADLFLALSPDEDIRNNTAYFYDLNAKVNYRFSDKDRVFASAYFGRDVFGFGDLFRFAWGNQTFSLRWNHLFSDRLFSNFTFLISDYRYQLGIPEGAQAFDWDSRIFNINGKADFTYYLNPDNTITFGASLLTYRFEPGVVSPASDENIFNEFTIPNQYALEPAAFISHETKIGNRLKLQYGARFSSFFRQGEEDIRIYEDGKPRDIDNIIDTVSYGKGETISSFFGFEPRLAVNYLLSDEASFKASYNRTRQYIHLVSNTTAATPVDIWTPAGPHVDPATADQFALGYFQNFNNNLFEASVEVYYKSMRDLLDYKNGAQLVLNPVLETELLSGDGRAYGLELFVRKRSGRLTGWISYTLSRSEVIVAGNSPEETINNGDWYSSNWDKTHDVSVVATYSLNKKWDVSTIFAFQTGRPITYPDGRFVQDGIIIPVYNNRNGARIPSYHRLDFSANYTPNPDKTKGWQSSWSFGIYNVYGRRNAYSIFFRQQEENPTQTEAVRLSIFGSLVPFVTYNFTF